jgi:outer membrane protein OmpA-like peptidoglycan-associated protein
MFTSLLFLLILLSGLLFEQPLPQQVTPTTQVSGVCWDVTTAESLPAKVIATVGAEQVVLNTVPNSPSIRFDLPISTTQLRFEVPGYQAVTLPVKVLGQPSPTAQFFLYAYMAKKDSAAVTQMTQLALNFVSLKDKEGTFIVGATDRHRSAYDVKTPHGNRVSDGMQTEMKLFRKRPYITFEGSTAGAYRVMFVSAEGRIQVGETFTIGQGITFKEVTPLVPADGQVGGAADEEKDLVEKLPTPKQRATPATEAPRETFTLPESRSVFFDQSKYDLTPATQMALDSMASLLQIQADLRVEITGHTDNVGERSLNQTLAEYRARRVGNYLRQKGIEESRLKMNWEKPATVAVLNEGTETQKALKRRVVIQFVRP